MELSWSIVAKTLLLYSLQNSLPNLQDRRTSLIHKQPRSLNQQKHLLHRCLLKTIRALSSQLKQLDKNLPNHSPAHQVNAHYTICIYTICII